MSAAAADPVATMDWSAAAQGDIVELGRIGYWSGDPEGGVEYLDTPHGVVLISQTCDLVQVGTKSRVLVAPLVACTKAELSEIRKGQRPLRVLVGSTLDRVADLERMTTIPRNTLSGARVLDRTLKEQSGKAAGELAARIGRAFSRFAFPNGVHETFRKLQRKITEGYTRQSQFAAVLKRVEEFRVECDDWNRPGRELMISVIVPADYLPPADTKPDNWTWSAQTVTGARNSVRPEQLDLESISALILQNATAENDSALVELWNLWGERLRAGWLEQTDDEVVSITLEVVSAAEFTYERYVGSVPLDFSTLSLTDTPDAGPPEASEYPRRAVPSS